MQLEKSLTDRNWDFLPEINNSFDKSETDIFEIFLLPNNIGFKYTNSDFKLNLLRPIQPKILNLNANSEKLELLYFLNDRNAITVSIKEQIADTQSIECYSFSSLTIGFCDEAQLSIKNSKEKYKPLMDSSIMMIDGANKEFQLKLLRASDLNIIDEYELFFSISKNKFSWLSPIEELTKGFIGNLSFQGSTIGELVSSEIVRLPQRNEWLFFKIGMNLKKDFVITKNTKLFYDLDMRLIEMQDYVVFNTVPKNNISINLGFKYQLSNELLLSISASLYKNNLFGYEDITFTQRSEHHFNKMFGSINSTLKYSF